MNDQVSSKKCQKGLEKCGKCWVIIWHKNIIHIKLSCEIGIRFIIKIYKNLIIKPIVISSNSLSDQRNMLSPEVVLFSNPTSLLRSK